MQKEANKRSPKYKIKKINTKRPKIKLMLLICDLKGKIGNNLVI
jgi:hypothetical protein